jgi:3-methyladenine DNA glycosylase/8-oxoguanine DNA glycosylase
VPDPAAIAGCAPARLVSWDLAERRALALVRATHEVAAGRIDLEGPDHERVWSRLLAIPTIGRWTVEMLAVQGQGRHDVVPAADVGFLKLVGRWRAGGDPAARATEDEVRALFSPYGAWRGLAAAHALRCPTPGALPAYTPSPGRNSLVNAAETSCSGPVSSSFSRIQAA